MTRQSLPSALDIGLALAAGAATAAVFAFGLGAVSTPKAFEDRLGTLADQVKRAEADLRPARAAGPFGVDALCAGDAAAEARRLGDLVTAEATRGTLAVEALETRIEPAPSPEARATPVRLRFSVTGPYEGAVGLLSRLEQAGPRLFVDSLDLTPKVSNVTLSFSGRAFCGA